MTTTTEAGSLTLALRTAQSGLLTNQQALNNAANNIANVNTPEYSRKITRFESRVLAGFPAGVQLSEVTRSIDQGLLNSLRLQLSDFNAVDVQRDYFGRTQDLFGKPEDNFSVAHIASNFVNALESLADSPDKNLEQSELVRWASELSQKLQEMSTTIQELRRQADTDIATSVGRVNELVSIIGDLNDKIVRNSAVNLDTTDLQDQRDAALDELSENIDIRYFSRADGDVIVFTSGGRTLVDNVPSTLSHSAASSVTPSTTFAESDFNGIFVGANTVDNDITTEIRSGKLKGLIDLRDGTLADMQSQIDEMAAELRDTFNQVHNRGQPFPGSQSLDGTRHFIQSGTSTITFGGTTDTRIVLFDSAGNEQATTTVRSLLGSNTGTIDDINTAIETFLQANGAGAATVSVNSDAKVDIDLNTTSLSLAFRDEATTNTRGATASDAVIQYDADGDGNTDETVNGFSFFFGFNDFFVDGLAENIYESDVIDPNLSATAATLSFIDSTGTLDGAFAVSAGDSLSTIVTNINNLVPNVEASVVPDGAGVRLRIASSNGDNLIVTEAAGNSFLDTIGLHQADVRVAGVLGLRSDILATPANMSRGAVKFDTAIGLGGEYIVSEGDDSVAHALADTFTSVNAFDQAGSIPNKSVTLVDYAAAIVGRNASLANNNESDVAFNESLTNSLQLKSDNVRGVNLDEELANLIIFEQAFSAASRVINVIQTMFDELNAAIR